MKKKYYIYYLKEEYGANGKFRIYQSCDEFTYNHLGYDSQLEAEHAIAVEGNEHVLYTILPTYKKFSTNIKNK